MDYIYGTPEEIKEIVKKLGSLGLWDDNKYAWQYHPDTGFFTICDGNIATNFTLKQIKEFIKDTEAKLAYEENQKIKIEEIKKNQEINDIINKVELIGESENIFCDCEFHKDKQLFTIRSAGKTTIYTLKEIKEFIENNGN